MTTFTLCGAAVRMTDPAPSALEKSTTTSPASTTSSRALDTGIVPDPSGRAIEPGSAPLSAPPAATRSGSLQTVLRTCCPIFPKTPWTTTLICSMAVPRKGLAPKMLLVALSAMQGTRAN